MKTKIALGVLAVALVAVLIAGGMGAWFTADADLPEAEFTAGTLKVDVEGPEYFAMEDRHIDNVNPGDCATVCWEIENVGTKRAELRVKLNDAWGELGEFAEGEDPDARVAFYYPAPGSGWVLYADGNDMYAYYTGGPVAGTYGEEDDGSNSMTTNTIEPGDDEDDGNNRVVRLCLVVAFDGPLMGNAYQEATYTINGRVEAVQATNDAPSAVWGNVWGEVNDGEYSPAGLAATFLAKVSATSCYNGGNGGEEPEPDPDPETYKVTTSVQCPGCTGGCECGSVMGDGEKVVGSLVTLTATANSGYKFKNWQVVDGGVTLSSISSTTTTFTMPANDVSVQAVFEKVQKYTVTTDTNGWKKGSVTGGGQYEAGATVTLKATANSGYRFDYWQNEGGATVVNDGNKKSNPLTFTMPARNVRVKAHFN